MWQQAAKFRYPEISVEATKKEQSRLKLPHLLPDDDLQPRSTPPMNPQVG